MDFSYSDDPALLTAFHGVRENPEASTAWEELVNAAEGQEGGLGRNSSPQAIAGMRSAYDHFFARFPLYFAYWKRYADLEFSIGGTETAELVYERAVACVSTSVDLWVNYCSFKIDTSHDIDANREFFERAAACVGLDAYSGPFWIKYMEYEERNENHDRVFAILLRLIHIPISHSDKFIARFKTMSPRRPCEELAPEDIVLQFRDDIRQDFEQNPITAHELERELRARLDKLHAEIIHQTQVQVHRRAPYEGAIERPYFHVDELSAADLANWRKYLDFEETEGHHMRIKFLYERCVTICASYDEFWFRYVRWTLGQKDLPEQLCHEEARIIFQRASCVFIPICRPEIRLQWARFEESAGGAGMAVDILRETLTVFPAHVETMVALAETRRRSDGVQAALQTYDELLEGLVEASVRGPIVAAKARMIWEVVGDVPGARAIFEAHREMLKESRMFWVTWLTLEIQNGTKTLDKDKAALVGPSSDAPGATEQAHAQRVYEYIRTVAIMGHDVVASLTKKYLQYLVERGGKEAMKEYVDIDRDMFGPFSVSYTRQAQLAENGDAAETQRRLVTENGHAGVPINEARIRQGHNPYTDLYAQQGEYATMG